MPNESSNFDIQVAGGMCGTRSIDKVKSSVLLLMIAVGTLCKPHLYLPELAN